MITNRKSFFRSYCYSDISAAHILKQQWPLRHTCHIAQWILSWNHPSASCCTANHGENSLFVSISLICSGAKETTSRQKLRQKQVWSLTYFQPIGNMQRVQNVSLTTCIPVVISRFSFGPKRTLTTLLNKYARPFLEWNCCSTSDILKQKDYQRL